MKKSLLVTTCAGLLIPMLSAQAQNRPPRAAPPRFDDGFGPPRPPFGPREDGPPRGPRPRPGAKGQLQGLWHDLDHLAEAGQPLSKAQAGKIVALVRPWTAKPHMTDVEAQRLLDQLQATLTSAQRNEVGGPPGFGPPHGPRGNGPDGFGPPPPRGFGDGPPPGAPDGRPPRDDNRPPRDDFGPRPAPPTEKERAAGRAFFEGSNPFYPPTGYASWKSLPSRFQQDVSRHYRESRATLEALSRQSKG